jgi:hypothetical protein
VDGAKIILWVKGSSGFISNVGYFYTNHTGKITEIVGAGKEYAYQVYHPVFGWLPTSTTGYYLTPSGVKAKKNFVYTVTANFQDKMPEILIANKLEVPLTSNYGVHLTFETKEIITGTYADVNQSEFGRFDTVGITSVFICDETNFLKYNSAQSFDAYQVNLRIVSGNIQIPLPAEGKWYVILSNELLKANYQNIIASCELTSNANPQNTTVQIYPNPINTQLQLKNTSEVNQIRIIDIFGKIVQTLPDAASSWKPDESLPNGLYYLQYYTAGKTFTAKLVLNRHK